MDKKLLYMEYEALHELPLSDKIEHSLRRIRAWLKQVDGYISFSGSKDSTVMLDLIRSVKADVPAVFCDTGLEYPEIRAFVKSKSDVTWVKPKLGFKTVLERYGYPVASKEVSRKIYEYRKSSSERLKEIRMNGYEGTGYGKLSEKWKYLIDAPFEISDRCCYFMKKAPMNKFKQVAVGIRADEGYQRKQSILRYDCVTGNAEKFHPLAFWKDEDIDAYIKREGLEIAGVYDMGYKRTGCMYCMYGVHMETEPNRFQRMATTHPKQYRYCIEDLGLGAILDYIGINYSPNYQHELFDNK